MDPTTMTAGKIRRPFFGKSRPVYKSSAAFRQNVGAMSEKTSIWRAKPGEFDGPPMDCRDASGKALAAASAPGHEQKRPKQSMFRPKQSMFRPFLKDWRRPTLAESIKPLPSARLCL